MAPEGVDLIIIGRRRTIDEEFGRLTGDLRLAFSEIAARKGSC
jgi:hypothetical protein